MRPLSDSSLEANLIQGTVVLLSIRSRLRSTERCTKNYYKLLNQKILNEKHFWRLFRITKHINFLKSAFICTESQIVTMVSIGFEFNWPPSLLPKKRLEVFNDQRVKSDSKKFQLSQCPILSQDLYKTVSTICVISTYRQPAHWALRLVLIGVRIAGSSSTGITISTSLLSG